MASGDLEGQVLEDALRRYLEADDESLEGDKVAQAVQDAMTAGMEHVLADLKARAPQMLADRRAERVGFQARLYATWREAFDLYEITWECAQEAGAHFNETYRPEAAENNDIVFDVLVRLHARACHIAAEIYSLLRNGQATGAMARWRSLHEVSIVTFLVREHGSDLAQRYIDHEVVESIKVINEYNTYRERLGFEPGDPAVLTALLARRQQLCRRYGADFKTDRGWAAKALKKPNPTIRELEEAVKLDHLRPQGDSKFTMG